MKYVIITPVKDEKDYILKTIDSVINQTIKPLEWIIVDDGSEDNTFEIASAYSNQYSWIKVIRHQTNGQERIGGAKVVRAFNYGYNQLSSKDYHFLVKLDGDIEIPLDYFESVIKEFKKDARLGLCGGIILNKIGNQLVQEYSHNYHVRGAFKAIRKECFEQIGGFKEIWNWDGIDELEAMYYGWRTATIPKYVVHFRPTSMAYNPIKHAFRSGYEAYRTRNTFFLTIVRAVNRLRKKPLLFNSISYLLGYTFAFLRGESRYINKDLAKFINRFHYHRILEN